MYKEVNSSYIYQDNFSFPIQEGKQEVKINCTSWSVYILDDIGQGLACEGTGTITTAIFEVENNTNLILEDYINNIQVSFWEITITEIISEETTSIFSTQVNMLDFYIYEGTFFCIIVMMIFFKKLIYNLKF
jgi:hypothetical protein